MGIFQQYGFHHIFVLDEGFIFFWLYTYKNGLSYFFPVYFVQQKWVWQLLLLGIHHGVRNDRPWPAQRRPLSSSVWWSQFESLKMLVDDQLLGVYWYNYPKFSVIDWRSSQKWSGNPYVGPFNLGWFDMMGWNILINYMIFHGIFMAIIYEVINLKLCFDLHFPLVNFHILLWKDPPLMGKSTN